MSNPIVRSVILDIEGTTTPISFVYDVLFPYVRQNLKSYLTQHWESDIVKNDVSMLFQQNKLDRTGGDDKFKDTPKILYDAEDISDSTTQIQSVVDNVFYQMDRDRKSTPLKQLQGHIWLQGYQQGTLKGVVFDDVPVSLEKWKQLQIPVYIFSSGSVEAQKLLFNYSDHGDLIPMLSGHFDTTIGSKLESISYTNIIDQINLKAPVKPSDFLFVTDSIHEAKAAKEVGLNVSVSIRPGNPPIQDPSLPTFNKITDFHQLFDQYKFGK
ncbi:hypothetical protein DLAC_01261 [Tieghemostelium lacteum]|uniref:Enolase-phosphatase E1 n=1 Tax=Tieghemostelium lacteum TaxID=361077 RepID=A0A152A8H6_TIELA|nr:hypothetical protein DLAC_01261 [Tieghemostelium lacteum]|eukprot:KYR02421.1 hypothetical protein DLAC_01261 [Tieghemostelium lacteum]